MTRKPPRNIHWWWPDYLRLDRNRKSVDRKGENFVVGCIPQGLAVQGFKIPIEKESFWARILADSEDVATFAYVATRCFETDLVRCRGPKEQWMNTTALFSTAVSLCQDRIVTQEIIAQQTTWTLKDSEAYLIGLVDAPLLVRVLRPNTQDEPELLVSMSTIIAPFLRRWSRKQGYKRPWRLREQSYRSSASDGRECCCDCRL